MLKTWLVYIDNLAFEHMGVKERARLFLAIVHLCLDVFQRVLMILCLHKGFTKGSLYEDLRSGRSSSHRGRQ